MGEGNWWYKVQSVEILSAMTTTKTIEYLKIKWITPKGITEEGTGDRVEAMALPAPSSRRRAQRSREMGIIGRDGRKFYLRGEGGIRPHGSGSGISPTMAGRALSGDWRTGPQTSYTTTPRGGTLETIESPGMMGADDGRAPPCRDEMVVQKTA